MEANNCPGVSIVICCYNSSSRLPETLDHLLRQEVPEQISWEIIVVDNASTDETERMALSCWPDNSPAPLKVVRETRLGLAHARMRGFNEAKYEVVSFLDDDNWAAPNWVRLVSEIMKMHPEVGACGGQTIAAPESTPPPWFSDYSAYFAIGKQGDKTGDVTWSRGWLWGAGLTVRKKAWFDLIENGFQPLLIGRSGKSLSAGEDVELCMALRLAEWQLWYSEELILKHFIPSDRLSSEYLVKLRFGIGSQTVGHDPYKYYARHKSSEIKTILGRIWIWQLVREMFIAVFRTRIFSVPWFGTSSKAFRKRLHFAYHWGRLTALSNSRAKYDQQIVSFEKNRWIRVERQAANFLSAAQAQSESLAFSTCPENLTLITLIKC